MSKYSISFKWSDEDKGFIAIVPELPGLSAFGETPEEAMSELQIASRIFLDALKESGEILPAPQKFISHSGQIRLRMPKHLHAELTVEAENEGISLNTHIVTLLAERHSEKQIAKILPEIREIMKSFQRIQYTTLGENTTTEAIFDKFIPAKVDTLNAETSFRRNN